jgi:hypothetical protein
MHLGSAPRIPCPPRRLVRALFPAADAGCAQILWLPMSTEDLLHYSRYPIRQRSLAASCRLLRSALFSDSCCSGTMCGCRQFYRVWCTCTGVEALRQLVMMQPWPPSLPAEAHTYADCPLRRTAAPLWYPSPCLFCMFLAVRQLSYGIREEYDYLRGVTSHRLLRL